MPRTGTTRVETPGGLTLEPESIRAIGYRIVDMVAREFAKPGRRPPFPPEQTRESMEAVWGGPVPREATEPHELLDVIEQHLLPAAGNPNHPGLMAYVLTASAPLAALVEALVGTIKLRPTLWKNQPASCHIEVTVARWLGEMVGFAPDAAGYLTTGGSSANLAALAVARVRKAGWDVRAEGVSNHVPLVAYVSAETHSCIERSAQLLGLGDRHLRKIPVDADFRIRLDLLEDVIQKDLAAGCRPFCLVGNAGTVNTGAVDPLDRLADVAARHDMWFHVDGAYGAFAALAVEFKPLFAGIERADSLTVDPHKWLNTPFEAGCLLTRSWDDLRATFSLIPAYLGGVIDRDHDQHDQYEYGFELSRTDRALKVWLALRQYGVDHYAEMIANHLALARHLAGLVEAADDFELASAPVLSICCFRFIPPDLRVGDDETRGYVNELNRAIEMELARDGRALVSGTDLDGTRVLRACIASHAVTRDSVEATFGLLRTIGHRLHAERRQRD